jgi:hypothetical protein
MRVVYLKPEEFDDPPPQYRIGEAGLVTLNADGKLEAEARVRLSANSVHALLGHGVVDLLNELPLEGRIGDGVEAVIPPAVLDEARATFYAADRKTYGGSWEFVVHRSDSPDSVEYRVAIDNREYQVSLARLVDLSTMASRQGHAVWIRI